MPQQGSLIEHQVRALSNADLAAYLDRINALAPDWRRIVIAEAARRLRWPDSYDKMRSAE